MPRRRHRQTITVTDLFCGAGGSSIGAEAVGASLRMAANHWPLAIETHAANFKHADHDCADVSQVDPRRYPTTDILLASPECTHHSQARSKKHDPNLFNPNGDPAAERSRATMWDVPRFAEHHQYAVVIVENVVEVRRWKPWPAWLAAMDALGYEHEVVYLNSMVAPPTPQSRDRLYVVFWRRGNRKPNLDIRPRCWCPTCGDVEGRQAWKKPFSPGGKYRTQYVYVDAAGHTVLPYAWPAASAIDWSLPCPRIGDRDRPLAEATLRRIRIGLDRFGPTLVQRSGHTYEAPGSQYARAWPVAGPAPTQTTEPHHGLALPAFLLRQFTRDDASRVRSIGEPLGSVVAEGNHDALVAMPFVVSRYDYNGPDASRIRGIDAPLAAMTANATQHALVVPVHHSDRGPGARPAAAPWPSQTGRQEHALVIAQRSNQRPRDASEEPIATVVADGGQVLVTFVAELRGGSSDARAVTEPLSVVTAEGNHHALVVKNYGDGRDPSMTKSVTSPFGTVTAVDHHALLGLPFTVDYHGNGQASPIVHPLPTQDTRDRHGLVAPSIEVEDCGFRMLEPHEIGRAMAFPDSYVVLGNKRQRVRQYGNAVTPPVMSLLVERAVESLA